MTEKVVGLHGRTVTEIAPPSPNALIGARELLERVESGEVQGFCAVTIHRDRSASYMMMGNLGTYSLLGALTVVQRNLMEIVEPSQ